MLYVGITPLKKGLWEGIICGIFSPNFINADLNDLINEIVNYIELNCKRIPRDVEIDDNQKFLDFKITVNRIEVRFFIHAQIV